MFELRNKLSYLISKFDISLMEFCEKKSPFFCNDRNWKSNCEIENYHMLERHLNYETVICFASAGLGQNSQNFDQSVPESSHAPRVTVNTDTWAKTK